MSELKTYIQLNAFELGQLAMVLRLAREENIRLPVRLRKKLDDAVNQCYLDSGYTAEELGITPPVETSQ